MKTQRYIALYPGRGLKTRLQETCSMSGSSATHRVHSARSAPVRRVSHPHLPLNNRCTSSFISKRYGSVIPRGSKGDITYDSIPRSVGGRVGGLNLTRNSSVAVSHQMPKILSLAGSPTAIGLSRGLWSSFGIPWSNAGWFASHFVRWKPPEDNAKDSPSTMDRSSLKSDPERHPSST